jgi:hypothetical protein
MGMAAPTYWTAEMVRQLPDDGNRYEVVRGELLVTPSPRFDHQLLVSRLAVAIAKAARLEVNGATAQPGKIPLAQRLAHAGEYIHDIVGLGRVAANRPEDQTTITLDEKIPGSLGITRFQRSDPRLDHAASDTPSERI